jgi:ABC-type branched-subunit amino acid transport system ATPase component/ABC-type branched-subunit amino acid transport system permease subunit
MTPIVATLLTSQVAFDGVVEGLVFGLLAIGIVLVYRATRVINFAVGNMGLIGAGLMALLVVDYHVPYWLAVIAGLIAGTAYGAVIDLVVIRRLFDAPRVIVLVATIGVAQLSLAILTGYPKIEPSGAPFPQAIGHTYTIGSVEVAGSELAILVVVPLVALLLAWFLGRTTIGKTVKASADNQDLARLAGINPKRVSTMVWAIAGALATLSLCLIASQTGSADNLATLGPATLVRALAAAVIAGMTSFWRAFVAGIAIGVVQAAITFNYLDQPGLTDFLVLIAVLVAVYFQSRSQSDDSENVLFVPRRRPVPPRLADRWWVRNLDRLGLLSLGVVAVVVPIVVSQPSRHLLYATILLFALAGISLTVLTGWLGQVSLGQMAFAGIGAFMAAAFHRGITLTIGVGGTHFDLVMQAMGFGPSVLLAAGVTALLAVVIGVGALRVRGLLLAVSTFAFAEAASQFLYNQPLLSGGFADAVPMPRSDLFGLNIDSQRTYYFVVLAVVALTIAIVARLRRTGAGRTTIGVRDNPSTAAAYTVSATRVKLRAFALAGLIAGLAGALLAGATQQVQFDQFYTVQDSLALVSIVVIGGLGSISGPILGALWVIGLPAFFPGNDVVPLLSSSIGLLFLLLYFPGGLVQIAYGAKDTFLEWMDRRLGAAPVAPVPAARAPVPARPERAPLDAATPALQTIDVSVHFGGIAAVDEVSIAVGADEIVGLIGTNGAGKSTLMNAVGGFTSSSGAVELFGERISDASAVTRARRGLGRTFQAATLFPELTVRETVQLALEARGHTGLISAALCLPRSVRLERRQRAEADELIDFLGLGRYSPSYISDLSTGTRRVVELAGLLALDARLLCLDEPTAGLAQRETEAFGPLIVEIRRELGAAVLVIEHDMPLIMGISDRVYCLELGRVIAEGPPAEVRQDTAVIASYLGTDERSIARSGAAAVVAAGTAAEGERDG